MPPATLIALAPYVLGGAAMIGQNVENKATIKNAENATAAAQQQTQKNVATAQNNLAQHLQTNPGPAQWGTPPPAFPGANIPIVGQLLGQQQMQQNPQLAQLQSANLPPQVQQLLAQMIQKQGMG